MRERERERGGERGGYFSKEDADLVHGDRDVNLAPPGNPDQELVNYEQPRLLMTTLGMGGEVKRLLFPWLHPLPVDNPAHSSGHTH